MVALVNRLSTPTGHEVHFLSRLERVNERQTDLALALYRDRGLVLELLADPSVREAAAGSSNRVAIALDPGPSPPVVIVARDGGFVTCLGSAMVPRGLAVVPWERVAILLRRAHVERDRLARARALLAEEGSAGMALERIRRSSGRLSREGFVRLATLEPLLGCDFLSAASVELGHAVHIAQKVAATKRIRPTQEALFRELWTRQFVIGHLLVATGAGGRRRLDDLTETAHLDIATLFETLLLPSVELGFAPLAFRAVWAMGGAGKAGLSILKQAAAKAEGILPWAAATAGLVVLALRHQKLRTEVMNAVGRLPPSLREHTTLQEQADCIRGMIAVLGANGTVEGEHARRVAAEVLVGRGQRRELVANDPFLLAHLANQPFDGDRRRRAIELVLGAFALATADAKDLYFPEENIALSPRFDADAALAAAAWARPFESTATGPRRNDPCQCGSGKKFKRCCGA